jgi:mono/diheme cytochrome c family protein
VPPPLTGPGSHLGAHTDGNLHEIIANGLPGGMPAWAGSLDDDSIWDLVNFLRVLDGASIAPGAGGSPPAPSGHQRG